MTVDRRHLLHTTLAAAATAAVLGTLPGTVRAQATWPTKPIRFVVPFAAAGTTDILARALAPELQAALGQQVIVDNKPGVGGRMAGDMLLAAPADGLTFMVAPNATPTFQMLVFKDQIKWNSLKDWVPVASFASYPLGMGVAAKLGVSNAREFVQWVKKNPGKSSYGTPGLGGQNAFLGVQFAKAAGIDSVVFDRGGNKYHGRVAAVADGAREGGLNF